MAVGRGVTVGVGVSGMISTIRVEDGFMAGAEEQAASVIHSRKTTRVFLDIVELYRNKSNKSDSHLYPKGCFAKVAVT